MKKTLFFLIILYFSISIANAQWIQQSSGVNTQLFKIKFLNRYTGWTCGAGVILKTTDGGNNWVNVPHPAPNKNFYGLCILDSNTIYVTGYFETILKTTNSGQSWIEIKNGPVGQGLSYRAVFFINYNTGWIGTLSQKILKTTNAGQNFIEYFINYPYEIYDLYFKDSLNGIGIDNGNGPYKTTNGGINWYYASIYLGTIHPWFYNASVINNQYCFLPGSDGRIFKSTDFGETWDSIGKTPLILGTNSGVFANLMTGWVGGNYYNKLFKTTNGGLNWIQENVIPFGWFSIFCYNELVVWGVSGPNFIMHTTTGGQPFSQVSSNNKQIISRYELFQNYPNPFNPSTKIKYQISEKENGELKIGKSFISIKISDVLGREISTLVNEKQSNGIYEVRLDGYNFSAGIYFYALFADNLLIDTKKMVIIK
jgi:photosystem II stability/assembly factor-like uncharacterized protein